MTESQSVRHLQRLPSLDGLRALAVVLTSLVHLVPDRVPGGFIGVDIFFVISGFLITSILLDAFARDGRIDLVAFYVRRARRLLPAVFVLILVFSLVVVLSSPTHRDLLVAGVVDLGVLTYTLNWAGVVGHAAPWQVDHLWSLSVEEQFYLLWPILLIVLLRVPRRRTVMIITAGAALASTVGQSLVFDLTHSVSWGYGASPFHANGILLGCLLAQLYVWRDAEGPMRWIATKGWPVALSIVMIVVLSLTLGIDGMFTYDGGMLLAVLAAGVLVSAMVARDTLGEKHSAWSRIFSSSVLVSIGKRSYSIYLWQNFMEWVLTPAFRDSPL